MLLAGAGEDELRRTFTHWLWALGRQMESDDPAPWPPEDLDLEDMAMGLEDRVAEWRKPYIQQGLEQAGAHERQLLRRMAATLFDSATADRLAATLGTGGPAALDGGGRGDCALRDGRRTAAGNRRPLTSRARHTR